ncbi:hepatocyte cell adhesion molecule-like [Platysternon megacephalum]|uniref:Hepatocyte cell adhesion molecule-like n=1 Tax=Platysternon megacephalum TaxID=55544 RepID=A0A4D9E356_9SAUR|nr:hepatocyte cell adhesion molecule-like [Platysternon megacephalum]
MGVKFHPAGGSAGHAQTSRSDLSHLAGGSMTCTQQPPYTHPLPTHTHTSRSDLSHPAEGSIIQPQWVPHPSQHLGVTVHPAGGSVTHTQCSPNRGQRCHSNLQGAASPHCMRTAPTYTDLSP